MTWGPFSRRAALLGAGGILLAGCSSSPGGSSTQSSDSSTGANQTNDKHKEERRRVENPPVPAVTISAAHGLDAMWPNEPLEINVTDGTPTSVKFTDVANGAVFHATVNGNQALPDRGSLFPRASYTVEVTAEDVNGDPHTSTHSVTTINPPMVTEVDFRFADGEVIGNGMPVWVRFDLPVPEADRAAIERTASITTSPVQEGAWGWVDENTLQWRPKNYWEIGSTAHVEIHAAGLRAGDNWILNDAAADYRYGDLRVLQTNIDAHTTTCYRNGEVVKILPVSTGKPGYETMTGTKMIMDKEFKTIMDSTSYGVDKESAEGYRLEVYYAQRITWSGEYFHAAPWADASHGNDNVSHGCTGLSDENAAWLFEYTLVGDPCEFAGSTFPVRPEQTWGAWVYSWEDWQKLSALR